MPASRVVVRALVVVTSVVMLLALVVAYAGRAVVDSDQFANRATAALRDESVRAVVAERVTDELVLKQAGDLVAARPIIESIVSEVVGGRAFTTLFRAAARDVHRAAFARDQDTVTLTVRDVGTVVAAALEQVRPSLARRIESTGRVSLVAVELSTAAERAARTADAVRLVAPLLLGLAVILAVAALAVSRDRRRTCTDLGMGAAAGGILLVVAYGVLRRLTVGRVDGPETQAAAAAVWDAFLGDVRVAGWIYAGAGAVIAAAAASLLRPVDLREPLRRIAQGLAAEPERPARRALRAVGLIVAGLVVLLDRDAVLQAAFALAGVYLIYAGVSALLWLTHQPRQAADPPRSGLRGNRRPAIAATLAAALIAVTVGTFLTSGGVTTAAPARTGCLGHAELCERPLDEVALAATHNAMSAPLPGWFSSEQDRPIADQLRDGIRGLLIDTHYADRLGNGRLRTDVSGRQELRRRAMDDGVSPEAVDAALRLRGRLGFSEDGKRGAYVCHGACELGGTPLASVLDDVHDFLLANPDEVVVVINEDYITPADFVAAVQTAGLADLAFRAPTKGRWPSLREMIDRDQRVVFLAENRAGSAPWYQPAYEATTQETPFAFSKVAQLTDPASLATSCRPNRGVAAAPLFLVNHWVSTDPVPLPSNAAKVNAYRPLLRRLQECRRLRRRMPNLVAVNFYRRGDLLRAVDALNGVE